MTRVGTHHDVRKQLELTPRQRQVVELMARGLTNYQIGQALGISLDGAKWHVSEVIGKFEVNTREEAVACWKDYNSPAARISRAMNAIASVGLLRWVGAAAAGVVIAGVVIVAIAVAGGGSNNAPAVDPGTSPSPEPTDAGIVVDPTATPEPVVAVPTSTVAPTEELALRVYFLRDGEIASVQRLVPSTVAVGRAAIEALIAGPSGSESATGLASAVPVATEILGLTIEDGIATIDLSGEFTQPPVDDTTVAARVAQVVFTLTQYATVDSVIVLVDGEPLALLEDGPQDRTNFEDITPAIYVESPAYGAVVTSPFTISGTANTFEATFQIAILDAEGSELASQVVTAASGSGVRGDFEATVDLPEVPPGPLILRVYEASAEDGSPINMVDIPVILIAD